MDEELEVLIDEELELGLKVVGSDFDLVIGSFRELEGTNLDRTTGSLPFSDEERSFGEDFLGDLLL